MKDTNKLRGHLRRYLRWPLYMVALWVVVMALVYYLNFRAGLVVTAGTVVYLIISLVILRKHKPLIINDLVAFAQQYENAEKRMLEHLASPFFVLDVRGRMIWQNEAAQELTGQKDLYGKNISALFPRKAVESRTAPCGKKRLLFRGFARGFHKSFPYNYCY